jgi:phospho-N-acetylmuramoyl-pentapeptide-transferase
MMNNVVGSVLAFAVPFGLMAVAMPPFIAWLRRLAFGQFVREDGPQSHQKKQGTPTGGGLMMLTVVTVCIGLLAALLGAAGALSVKTLWLLGMALLVLWGLGGLGLADDGLKILKKHNKGVTGYTKLAVQGLVGLAIGWGFYQLRGNGLTQLLPGIGVLDLGPWYVGLAMMVVVSTSNAVNLTDGLDGLAANCCLISFITLALVALLYSGGGLVIMLALIMAGTVAGFLLFNKHPAQVFMGDSGSLALGGMVALLALACRVEWMILLFGCVFVAEAVSVIVQVVYFKRTGKRFFRMAPYHHHLELGGWSETKVVSRLVWAQVAGAAATLLCLQL